MSGSSLGTDSLLAKRYATYVKDYEINFGYKCTVMGEWEHKGQEAFVVGLNEDTVDIEIKTGKCTGQIVRNVYPKYLSFSAVIVDNEEETHS